MVHDNYSPEESLERIKLMMNYDLSKTLNENKIVSEQYEKEYFKEITKQFMKYPQNITIKPGQTTIDLKKGAAAFYKSIEGAGRRDTDYVIGKIFPTLADSIGILKTYPTVGQETIYDAIKGEWFAGGMMDKVVDIISSQLETWCSTGQNSKNQICTPKSKEEMKYGI
jgi:hypothetical protein